MINYRSLIAPRAPAPYYTFGTSPFSFYGDDTMGNPTGALSSLVPESALSLNSLDLSALGALSSDRGQDGLMGLPGLSNPEDSISFDQAMALSTAVNSMPGMVARGALPGGLVAGGILGMAANDRIASQLGVESPLGAGFLGSGPAARAAEMMGLKGADFSTPVGNAPPASGITTRSYDRWGREGIGGGIGSRGAGPTGKGHTGRGPRGGEGPGGGPGVGGVSRYTHGGLVSEGAFPGGALSMARRR